VFECGALSGKVGTLAVQFGPRGFEGPQLTIQITENRLVTRRDRLKHRLDRGPVRSRPSSSPIPNCTTLSSACMPSARSRLVLGVLVTIPVLDAGKSSGFSPPRRSQLTG
jgi:hypothetical protein